MPQIVETNRGHSGAPGEGDEVAGDVLGVPGRAVRAGEDQAGVGPAEEERVAALLVADRGEHLDGDRVEGDDAFAVAGLGFAEFGAVADGQ
jgi:hypothetical protein